jgi:hypothetical protein
MTRSVQSHCRVEPCAQTNWLDLVQRQVESLRYGLVQIIVHDGHVSQIEKTERFRIENHSQRVTASPHALGKPAADSP